MMPVDVGSLYILEFVYTFPCYSWGLLYSWRGGKCTSKYSILYTCIVPLWILITSTSSRQSTYKPHPEEVGHSWPLQAGSSLIDFSYLNRLTLRTFTERGPQFLNQDSRLGPDIEKAKKPSTLQYPTSISDDPAFLISKFQPPLNHTSCLHVLFRS